MTRNKKIFVGIFSGIMVVLASLLLFTNTFAELLSLPLTIHENPRSADVIIVLGAGARKSGDHLPPQAKERVIKGFELIKQGYAERMILSGGLSKKSGFVEAQLMDAYAASLGASPSVLIEENQSTDTWENAVNSIAIMKKNDWNTALVVTSSYHTLRSCMVFRKLKASVRCIAAPLNIIPTNQVYERLTDLRSVIREYGAIVYFVFKHLIR